MNTKLVSLVLVVVLLGSSLGGILAVTQTKVADGATGGSAQVAPHFAQLNPDFVKYQQGLSAGNASKRVSVQAGTGFIPPPVNLTQLDGQSISSLVGAAPSDVRFDLRTQSKLTSVKAQLGCGACWAFAAYASLESYLMPSDPWDFSENNMKNMNPGTNMNPGFDIAPCGGGNEQMATAYLARWSGPVKESDDLYNPSSTSSPSNLPVQKHVQDVSFLPGRGPNPTDNNYIKVALTTYGAVYTTMYIVPTYPDQFNTLTNAYYYSQPASPDHAVAIVGWDDSYSRTNFASRYKPPGDGAFIVKNSWGTSWGTEQGYFYVSYYDAVIGYQDNAVFTAEPTTNYNNIYQYDPLGITAYYGSYNGGISSDWGANVFTATASDNLAAVSFYTRSVNAPYEVYVYTDPTVGPINPSQTAPPHVAGSFDYPGYHTVKLPSSVSLQKDHKFSVVVKFTSSHGTPVPTEAPVGGYGGSSQATANVGESYYHADAGSPPQGGWTDMTSIKAYTNICIKAFTTTAAAASPWGPWSPLSGMLVSGTSPAVCARDANSLDVFVEGMDLALWHKHYQSGSGWGNWESLGGVLTSSPAAASPASGKIDVFVRGIDGALWRREYNNGWQPWTPLGGILYPGTEPAASGGSGRLDVFVEGMDLALWHQGNSGAWSGWESLGGVLTSSPAAASPASGKIDVFVRGIDGALYYKSYSSNQWGGWNPLGGILYLGTKPAASSWGSGRLDVFVEGLDLALWHQGNSGAWSGWESLGGVLTSSPAAASPASGKIDVFVRGIDGALWQREYNSR